MVFKKSLSVLVLWTKVASALEGLKGTHFLHVVISEKSKEILAA